MPDWQPTNDELVTLAELCGHDPRVDCSGTLVWIEDVPSRDHGYPTFWRPHADIAQAWEVFEAAHKRGGYISIKRQECEGALYEAVVHITRDYPGGFCREREPTAPAAICRAVLGVLEAERNQDETK